MASAGPLRGIRILDLSIAATGPYAVAMLADQGADVVKVERPGFGEIGRWIGVQIDGISALYQVCNRGKRCIAVNLDEPAGRDVVRALAARSDVVVQNWRPGVAEKLGRGLRRPQARRPRLRVHLGLRQRGPVRAEGRVRHGDPGLRRDRLEPGWHRRAAIRPAGAGRQGDGVDRQPGDHGGIAGAGTRRRRPARAPVDARRGGVVPVGRRRRERHAARRRRLATGELHRRRTTVPVHRRVRRRHPHRELRLLRHVQGVRRRRVGRPARSRRRRCASRTPTSAARSTSGATPPPPP